ncbi:hypothetical protein [Actinosynnema mirum]|uniref:Uncharacterized protein n=1 Tax=Actinosynnema mirum (strain ATCC 29888 / DSM 43827 / JCM 3225 / NBRC 14064 / NCIMB 13271 / NRRL B-12336 / IMRU 3971 / 101) TaxID=446462 RepID=C6WMK9_ACTMD|nr:hypothetical protein [Actinosynnema mirum]ACU36538.1 hypothetical protein Amir_2601 [Actinosynnema mirum DSM 43827]
MSDREDVGPADGGGRRPEELDRLLDRALGLAGRTSRGCRTRRASGG